MIIKPRSLGTEFFNLQKGSNYNKGLPTGFRSLDNCMQLAKGYMSIITGYPSSGKALALDTPIPTPNGWTTMGQLQAGDQVYDEHGKPCNVVAVTEVMENHDCFKMVFSCGQEVVCDADHQWVTNSEGRKHHSVKTTREIAKTVIYDCDFNHRIYSNLCSLGVGLSARTIVNCGQVISVPVKCIQVDSESHQYLCTRSYIPTHNSEFLDMLLVNYSLLHGWKHLVYSPENHPIERHMSKLAEKLIGKPLFEMLPNEMSRAIEWLEKHFTWLYPDKPTLDTLLGLGEEVATMNGIDSVVYDPWNEVLQDRSGEMVHEYLSGALMKVRRAARKYDYHQFIVAHPKIPTPDKNGCLPRPELYAISDGAMWRNKADYGWTAHRADLSKHEIEIHVQKLKYKWMSIKGIQPPLIFDYDVKSGRFKEKHAEFYTIPEPSPF
jgi:hypothetical protein